MPRYYALCENYEKLSVNTTTADIEHQLLHVKQEA
jgi:hypothetical protein